ncbi:hypothetical protein BCR36DRAFT_586738 [Piromyces finnis]|uniref:MYND-type domain-containing protein n=1 Tax=Piromyces finnis TaxID=1754191 RepID=A0A1Y1UZ64_9FUNG|nr:hypothetical protein BCR36DRAFT_586738 [Piromyces finnis]|eukprot:ORX43251.1 hypothetical protein BCR36DRAFT_586738 [Piromyces finnis]
MAGNNNNKRDVACSNPACQKKWVQGQPMFKSCSQCGQAKYCSKECQKSHWKQHKRACKKRALQLQQQQSQSQQSIKSPQLNQQQKVTSPKLNQKKQHQQQQQQQQQNPSSSPQLKQGKKQQQSPQLSSQSNKSGSLAPSKPVEKDVKNESFDQSKLIAELQELKKEKQKLMYDREDALFFLNKTKSTIAEQNEKMESFTERLRLTLNKVEKIHESIKSVKAIC